MAINLERLNDSPFVISLIATLGQLLPLRLGHSLADMVAGQIMNHPDSPMVRAIRANQWVARGEKLNKDDLDQAVGETLRNSARSIFDLYHFSNNPQAAGRLIVLDAATQQLARLPEFDSRGLMIAGLHLGNPDLILQWLWTLGMRLLVLTIPDPQGGRRTEYERRKKTGINLIPASVGALRQSLRHLKRGGIVLTGIDRPIQDPGTRPLFFDRPAALPTHHIFLATQARVPLRIMVTNLNEDGKYHVMTSDPIEMDPCSDRKSGELHNAEKVLKVAETFVRQMPQQWLISLPVWPETLDLVP